MGKFDMRTRVKAVLADQRAVALVEEYAPGITRHPMVGLIKLLTLEQAFGYRNAVKKALRLTDYEIDEFIRRLMSIE